MKKKIIRYAKWGDMATPEVDDVVIEGDLLRMEKMSNNSWWIAIYRGKKRVAFDMFITEDGMEANLREDELGCVDDTEDKLKKGE